MGVDARPGRAEIRTISMSEVSEVDAKEIAQKSGAALVHADHTTHLRYRDGTVLSFSHVDPRREDSTAAAYLTIDSGLSVTPVTDRQLVLSSGYAAIVDHIPTGNNRRLTLEKITLGRNGIHIELMDVRLNPSRQPSEFDKAVIDAANAVSVRRQWPRS